MNYDTSALNDIEKEVRLLSSLNHKNILRFYGHGKSGCLDLPSGQVTSDCVYLRLQHVKCGDLCSIYQGKSSLGENSGRFILHQMLDALEYLQSKSIAHLDLKCSNILVDEQFNLKVADFDHAAIG